MSQQFIFPCIFRHLFSKCLLMSISLHAEWKRKVSSSPKVKQANSWGFTRGEDEAAAGEVEEDTGEGQKPPVIKFCDQLEREERVEQEFGECSLGEGV